MNDDDAIDALSALAQHTRLCAFRELVKAEPNGIAVGDLAERLRVPQNTLSTHLSILSRSGLVAAERRERSVIYRPQLDQVQTLTLFLLNDCCGGRPELCSPVAAALEPSCKPKRGSRVR